MGRARARTLAAWKARIATAKPSRRPPAPAARPGALISARKQRTAHKPSMPATASDRGPGRISKAKPSLKMSTSSTATTTSSACRISLTERGTMVAGVGYTPNYHDVLTGSQPDGRAFAAGEDRTCRNWTSSTQGAAMVGHIDRKGLRDDAASKSWNSSHPSRGSEGGCSQHDLRGTGGDGLFYCFAAN